MGPLAIQGLTKRYGDVVALIDLSLEVKGGEVFGFVGQWRRWRESGVWARAMTRLAQIVRVRHGRNPTPSVVHTM